MASSTCHQPGLPSQETGACATPPGWQVQPFPNLSTRCDSDSHLNLSHLDTYTKEEWGRKPMRAETEDPEPLHPPGSEVQCASYQSLAVQSLAVLQAELGSNPSSVTYSV